MQSFCSSAEMVSMVSINAYYGIFGVWSIKIGSYQYFSRKPPVFEDFGVCGGPL